MKPILFNTDMVRAILLGRKTVTRRAVKLPRCGYFEHEPPLGVVPPFRSGDVLYVRETWRYQPLKWSRENGYSDFELQYRADFTDEENDCYGRCGGVAPWNWRPSIHMKKEAARLFLRVTDVRLERLQDITEHDAKREGALLPLEARNDPEFADYIGGYYFAFRELWDSTIKSSDRAKYGWEENPWVWVIEFEKISREEASEKC